MKRAKARGQGRRKSRELEDLHMCASTGKFNLEKLAIDQTLEETEEEDTVPKLTSKSNPKKPMVRRQTDSQLDTKMRSTGSIKKTGVNSASRTSKPTMTSNK